MKIFLADLNNIVQQSHLIADYVDRLNPQDLDRYNRITDQNRRLQFLVGRMAIYHHFGADFQLAGNGKLISSRGYLSLAHSQNLVVLGISDAEIGVDTEDITKTRDFKAVAKHCHFDESENPTSFYKNFTQYEADYKIGHPVPNHTFVRWNDFMICISSEKAVAKIEWFKTIPFISCDTESVLKV